MGDWWVITVEMHWALSIVGISLHRLLPLPRVASFYSIEAALALRSWKNCLTDVASNRSRCSTIRSAALPSHFGGIAPFFHSPAINRASAGGSLLGSVPISSFVPIVMVSGRSVLSRSVKAGDLRLFLNRSALFVGNRQRLSPLCHILRFRAAGILQASLQLDRM